MKPEKSPCDRTLMNTLRTTLIMSLALYACSKVVEPGNEIPNEIVPDQMTLLLNGVEHIVPIVIERNGYDSSQVVLRGAKGLGNTLMLTFDPTSGERAEINLEMTGFWDLGLCRPFDKYLLTQDSSNFIRVTSSDTMLIGEFNLRFVHEGDSTDRVSFENGVFSARKDTCHFEYCTEG